jgi:uncharacterized protein
VKVKPDELSTLLELATLDANRSKLAQQLADRKSNEVIDRLSRQLSEANDVTATHRAELDRGKDVLRKLQNDVELVEKRLQLDETRLNTLSNAKDVTGVQHEIQSLKSRISMLEDQELELMEAIQAYEENLAESISAQKQLAETLAEEESSQQRDVATLSSELRTFEAERANFLAKLSEELASSYLRKADRGVAAARLQGRECGACMLALTSAAFDDVMATAMDDLPTCPNCQAMIIR